jgi:hypothetical protein
MPSPRSLLQTIERLDQMIRLSRISKTRSQSHVDLLIKITIEKCILNIKLTNMPTMRERAIESNNQIVTCLTTGLNVSS